MSADHAYVDRPLYSDIALWATDWPLAIVSALLVNVDITNMSEDFFLSEGPDFVPLGCGQWSG